MISIFLFVVISFWELLAFVFLTFSYSCIFSRKKNVNNFVFFTECSFLHKFRFHFYFFKENIWIWIFNRRFFFWHFGFFFFFNFKHLCQRSTDRFELINLEELAAFEKKKKMNLPKNSEGFTLCWERKPKTEMKSPLEETKYQCVQKDVSYLRSLDAD